MVLRRVHLIGLVLLAACEQSPKNKEREPEPPTPSRVRPATPPPAHKHDHVSERILAELRRAKPGLTFESVNCPNNVKPAAGVKMPCVVKHGDSNVDRHIEVLFSGSEADAFDWGRQYPGHSLDKVVLSVVRPATPVPVIKVACSEDAVSYVGTQVECTMIAGGEPVPIAISWLSKLGKFHVDRLVDMAKLKAAMRLQLKKRGLSVRSIACPRFILLKRPSRFSCSVHLTTGETMAVEMRVDGGNGTMGVPKYVNKTEQ